MHSDRLIKLAEKRGQLRERIAAQRATLAGQMVPVEVALRRADQAIAAGRAGVRYVKTHPLEVGTAVAVLAVLRPRRVWRWGRRAFVAWNVWRKLQDRLATLRPRPAA